MSYHDPFGQHRGRQWGDAADAIARASAPAPPYPTLAAPTLRQLLAGHKGLRPTMIEGLMRRGEIAILPQHLQRGTNIDGTLRAGPFFHWALAGNPFGEQTRSTAKLGDLQLASGTYAPKIVDLHLPADGAGSWPIGRTYSFGGRSGGSHRDSNGPQGYNWHQASQPEIVLYDDATDTEDVVYLVYGADRFAEFKRTGTGATTYKGVSASDGVLEQQYNLGANWRGDTVAVFKSDGSGVVEWVHYFAGGKAVNVARSEVNYDGTSTSADNTTYTTLWNSAQLGTYNPVVDMDLDGDADSTDKTLFASDRATVPATGYDRLSRSDSTTNVDNRIGYAGYLWDPVIKMCHVRNRVLEPHTDRWLTRDPLGYVEGMSLYPYLSSRTVALTDPTGLCPPDLASDQYQGTGLHSAAYSYYLYRIQWNWSVPPGYKKRVETILEGEAAGWATPTSLYLLGYAEVWRTIYWGSPPRAYPWGYAAASLRANLKVQCLPGDVVDISEAPGSVWQDQETISQFGTVVVGLTYSIEPVGDYCKRVTVRYNAQFTSADPPQWSISFPIPGGGGLDAPIQFLENANLALGPITVGSWMWCCKCHED